MRAHRTHECDCPHWDCRCGADNCTSRDGVICGVCGEPKPGSDAEKYSRPADFQRPGGPTPHTLPRREWGERDREIL